MSQKAGFFPFFFFSLHEYQSVSSLGWSYVNCKADFSSLSLKALLFIFLLRWKERDLYVKKSYWLEIEIVSKFPSGPKCCILVKNVSSFWALEEWEQLCAPLHFQFSGYYDISSFSGYPALKLSAVNFVSMEWWCYHSAITLPRVKHQEAQIFLPLIPANSKTEGRKHWNIWNTHITFL